MINACISSDHLAEDKFKLFCTRLNSMSPDRITKPKIGDIFKIIGRFGDKKVRQGIQFTEMTVTDILLLSRGDISRPGDFADKVFHKDTAEKTKISQAR
jgi:hypothetical protein